MEKSRELILMCGNPDITVEVTQGCTFSDFSLISRLMIIILPAKVKIHNFPSYYSGLFVSLDWHLGLICRARFT